MLKMSIKEHQVMIIHVIQTLFFRKQQLDFFHRALSICKKLFHSIDISSVFCLHRNPEVPKMPKKHFMDKNTSAFVSCSGNLAGR